jgi:hypothetical protein
MQLKPVLDWFYWDVLIGNWQFDIESIDFK